MHQSSGINFLITLLLIMHAKSEQRFIETPVPYHEICSGEDVVLNCRVDNKKGQCIWQKDGKPIGIHPDKYEWSNLRSNSVSDYDCGLLIKHASLEFDDGYWECQVTPGDFTRQDALTSLPSRLLVKVKPRKPRIEYGGTILMDSITLKESQEVTISCVSRYGNPPALIKWYIGGDEVEPLREQTNATEVDSPKTWAAHSLLKIKGQREHHGLPIRCLSLHPSSPLPAIAECRLDIHYSPEVHLETSPRLITSGLEDSASFMSIKCIADANPPASIRWYKDMSTLSKSNIIEPVIHNSTSETLINTSLTGSEIRFEPVKRVDTGLYSCKAVNIVGESLPANYRLDVQYGPRLKITPKLNETRSEVGAVALLGTTAEPFECDEFEANPSARYKWLHMRGTIPEVIDNIIDERIGKNDGKKLRLNNVVWSDEGEYRCVGFNIINGVRREMTSETRFILQISGPPEIQTRATDKITEKGLFESVGWAGDAVHRLMARFCSRPAPKLVAWQWGSSHIRAGTYEEASKAAERLQFQAHAFSTDGESSVEQRMNEENDMSGSKNERKTLKDAKTGINEKGNGESIEPKYEALPLEPIMENDEVTNCYWAKLDIRNLQKEDSRIYSLLVESEKGRDSMSLKVAVRDPTEIKIIAISTGVGLLLLLIIISLTVYSLHRAKHRRYLEERTEEDEEEDSIAADALYAAPNTTNQLQKSQAAPKVHPKKNHADSGLSVMYDYNQLSQQTRTMSPEALKVRRAPVVLQPPTIV